MNDNDTLADDLRKDILALMKLLADEKHKSEALAAELAELKTCDQAPIARLYVDNDGMAKAALYAPGLPAGQFDVYLESTAETFAEQGKVK